jgi:hypothetical protein
MAEQMPKDSPRQYGQSPQHRHQQYAGGELPRALPENKQNGNEPDQQQTSMRRSPLAHGMEYGVWVENQTPRWIPSVIVRRHTRWTALR